MTDETLDQRLRSVISHLQTGNYQKAEMLVESIIKENRTYAQGWVLLGQSLLFQELGLAAYMAFQRALLLDPNAEWLDEIQTELDKVPDGILRDGFTELFNVKSVTISAALIVKNEARCIERCIRSLIGVVDEIILVDTGSTDETVEIASKYPLVRIYEFKWVDDFSAARNYSLSKVTSDWVFVVDADEFLNDDDKENVKIVAGLFDGISPVPLLYPQILSLDSQGSVGINMEMPRLFPMRRNVQYTGRIHEQVYLGDSSLYESKFTHKFINIHLFHDGYMRDVWEDKRKDERSMELLTSMVDENPDDPLNLLLLGREYVRLRRYKEAVSWLDKAMKVAQVNTAFSRVLDIYRHLAICYKELNEFDKTLEICQEALDIDSSFPDIHYYLACAQVSKALEYYQAASSDIKKSVDCFESYHGMVSPDNQIIDWKANLMIADIARLTGDFVKSKDIYLKLLENPFNDIIEEHLKGIDDQLDELTRLSKPERV